MNTLDKTVTFLVGEVDKEGEFWCFGEHQSIKEARKAYNKACLEYPTKQIQLIGEAKTHRVIDTHYPKK
jgi:hypothetical protein